ncbi:MAG TPA: GH92 family glycosyl hydrolase [Arachidicoccus sp.]|nr:GH92 family glycosyl hydrolase [Arachidicoccus sp.]
MLIVKRKLTNNPHSQNSAFVYDGLPVPAHDRVGSVDGFNGKRFADNYSKPVIAFRWPNLLKCCWISGCFCLLTALAGTANAQNTPKYASNSPSSVGPIETGSLSARQAGRSAGQTGEAVDRSDLKNSSVIFSIGKKDGRSEGFALSPDGYKDFLARDFGWENKFYLIGYSKPGKDWPYILPGPADGFGGTGGTSGVRANVLNILFGLKEVSANLSAELVIDLVGYQAEKPALVKILVNGHNKEFRLPKGGLNKIYDGDLSNTNPYTIHVPVDGLLQSGGNTIEITSLDGSWIVFDAVRLLSKQSVALVQPNKAYLRSVKAADYTVENDQHSFQPLLVDIQQLTGQPELSVKLDGKSIFEQKLDTGRFDLEVPMPAVNRQKESEYAIYVDGNLLQKGRVTRSPEPKATPADYVDTRMGTAHSRWMIAPGPWMPFSMVKLSPDNQDAGWTAGYDPIYESVGTFSHIHEWTLAGLGTFPTSGPLKTKVGSLQHPETGYRSKMDKSSEVSDLGYYKVLLTDHHIKAELTATTRCSFQRYTYAKGADARIMVDLKIPAEYNYRLKEVTLKKVSEYRLEGSARQYSKNVWSGGVDQDYTVHFVMEFDHPIKKFGTWSGDTIGSGDLVHIMNPSSAGAFVEFDTREHPAVQVRTGISLVSLAGAAENLKKEVTDPFGWSFDKVRQYNKDTWNGLFGKLQITSNDRIEKKRFYTNLFRSMASRNIWSDVDGKWVDASGRTQQLKDTNSVALGCDAFWNTFWNLNQLWNLAYPDWSSKWVKSQLAMYDANGWLAKGPAGMNYIPVMVAEHEIPLMVGAYQMGIRDYDANKALKAMVKMQTTPSQKVGNSGYAGNRDLIPYLKHHYVPYDQGRFSNSLEYCYDDWTVSQMAKSLGDSAVYREFKDRGTWWKNVIDTASGYARMRKSDGTWFPDFDPFRSGANEHYVEGNAWQLTYYVPQDVPGLIDQIGKDRFVDRLSWGFKESAKLRYNAPGDQYWDYPVIQGNEQSMQFAFLFNWAGKPWLTQKWSRSILDRYYGTGVSDAYLGDEDQGQMSAWFVMVALGLFQTDGGASAQPIYEIGSPIFEKVTINLDKQYGRGKAFTVEAKNVSRTNQYVQSATLNGKALHNFYFSASELLKGGSLVLQMGPKPNEQWGVGALPAGY